MGKEEETDKNKGEEEGANTATTTTKAEEGAVDEENAIRAVEDAATAAAAAMTTTTPATNNNNDVGDRDCLLLEDGEIAKDVKMNVFLQDMIYFQRVLRKLEGKAAPAEDAELDDLADRIVKFMKGGKPYELAGLKSVPYPFLKSPGRILTKEANATKELSDEDAKNLIRKKLFDEFKKEEGIGSLDESPYKEFKELIQRKVEPSTKENPVVPNSRDTLLLHCNDKSIEKLYEHQSGNKVIFNLASQIVTTNTTDSESRVEAALNIVNNFDAAEIPLQPDEKPPASKVPRFLVRGICEKPEDVVWEHLSGADVADFLLSFVFEVVLEKEIAFLPSKSSETAAQSSSDSPASPSTDPVSEPTDYDVLFGRGGMTNSHPGNKRFRDIIALHRPDYIRAIKMDKPAVARKIVKAIRQGNPPGRFMKKGEDGLWHDVGDRTAAEKTSQGLRERSNAEKRQRSELRRALRIRKEDLQEDDGTPSAKKAKVENSAAGTAAAASTAAALTPTLNYVGTNLAVPLSLSMTQIVSSGKKKSSESKGKASSGGITELNTEGLPPNAVDEEGNILVTDYDILCGRGGLTNHHKGNKRFRDIVALHRPDYVRAPKIQKPSVARVIVRAIRNGDPPGRFLKKDEETGKWIDIGDKKAAEKTSQALREKSNEERDGGKRDSSGVGVLLPNPATYLANANLATTTASVMGNILASTVDPSKPSTADGEKSKENEDSAKEGEKKKEDDSEKKEGEKAGEEKESTVKAEAVEAPELPDETADQQTASV